MISEYISKVGTHEEEDYIDYTVRQRILLQMLRYQGSCPIERQEKQDSFNAKQNLPKIPVMSDSCWQSEIDDMEKQESYLVLNEVMTAERDAS